ncbi:hypothetical protein [Mucilaginibacter pineti]|uniref:hypothetical protein n=1 Tax=Mucilaginibacter pineti TaxID=1391627 RepID=UPI000B861F05|nr:hypothetical protein [Mucilaginibacter pineti]
MAHTSKRKGNTIILKADTIANATTQPAADQAALTLPVLDALFYEPGFTASLKSKIGLTTGPDVAAQI